MDDDGRLTTLEENFLFAERALESMSEQVAALQKAVDTVSRRLAGLEARFEARSSSDVPGADRAGEPADRGLPPAGADDLRGPYDGS